tara:strand:+ start:73 stop:405 length:333 start_codon:yes stop_codon:yes gene_type:complete
MSDFTKKNGSATAALVLGIVSIALFFIWFIAIPCAIVAIILAAVAKNKIKADPDLAHTSGQATGGLITGIIGLVIGIILIVIAAMAYSTVSSDLDAWEDLANDLEQYENY